ETFEWKGDGLEKSAYTCVTLYSQKNKDSLLENCTAGHTFDYFVGTELSLGLIFTFLTLLILAVILLVNLMVYCKNRQSESMRVKASKLRRMTISDNVTLAQEWVDHIEPYRSVEVILNGKNKSIKVRLESGERVLRSIYLKDVRKVWIECNHRSEERRVGKERGSETGSGR